MSAGPLLATKMIRPALRANPVARERLLARLDEGLALGRSLTLVSAPPGFGKTTLILQWLQRLDRRVAWLTLDDGDNDPLVFIRYLAAALGHAETANDSDTIRITQMSAVFISPPSAAKKIRRSSSTTPRARTPTRR